MTTSISEFMARAHARAQESRLQQAVVEQKARRVWSRFDAKLEAAREMSSQTVENQRAIFELADARAWLSHISMDWSLMSTYMLYNVAPDVVLMSVDFDRLLRESKGAMHEPSLAHLHAANCRNPFKSSNKETIVEYMHVDFGRVFVSHETIRTQLLRTA